MGVQVLIANHLQSLLVSNLSELIGCILGYTFSKWCAECHRVRAELLSEEWLLH